jgi:perosamine synthetase
MTSVSQNTAMDFVPLSVPTIAGNEWRYLKECLDTGWVSSVGSFVDRFESLMARLIGRRHAVATVNGTASLHLALLVAGVEAGDEVVVSTLTFIAPANAIRYVGAWPVFVDAEPRYWQIDLDKVRDFLQHGCRRRRGALRNVATGRRVRAIVPVDILGHPVDMQALRDLAQHYGLPVVEDASESLGALYLDDRVGHLGDIACFSFNGNKIVTTGGGGILVTDDAPMARLARHLSTQAKHDALEYIHDVVGFNYRLTNLQAAMGVAQLEQLDTYVAAKRRIASRYRRNLADVPGLTLMAEAPWARASYWLTTALVDPERFGMDARSLIRSLRECGVESRPLWQPLHRSPAHRGAFATDCSVAERLHATGISLPSSVGLSRSDQHRVIDHIAEIGLQARRLDTKSTVPS